MVIDPKDIKIGDLVVCPQKPKDTAPWPGWDTACAMDAIVGKPLRVVEIFSEHRGIRAYSDDDTSKRLWVWHTDWLDLYNPTPVHTLPQCNCPIFQGCSCGAFVAEMAAKGKVRNPVTKLWEAVL